MPALQVQARPIAPRPAALPSGTIAIPQDLPPIARDRLWRGVGIASRLRHPGLVPVVAIERTAGATLVSVPPAAGPTAARVLRRCANNRAPLPVSASLRIAAGVCRALDHVHHATTRDGTPLDLAVGGFALEQIRLGAAGEVALVPLPTRDLHDTTRLSRPELDGATPTVATDLRAVAVLLVELLAGRPLARTGCTAAGLDVGYAADLLRRSDEELRTLVLDALAAHRPSQPGALGQLAATLRGWAFARSHAPRS